MESATLTVALVRSDVPVQSSRTLCCGRFSTGIEQLPDTPSKQRVGRFSDGIAQAADAEPRIGRFSTGIERPETPDLLRVGSFADGCEQIPRR